MKSGDLATEGSDRRGAGLVGESILKKRAMSNGGSKEKVLRGKEESLQNPPSAPRTLLTSEFANLDVRPALREGKI